MGDSGANRDLAAAWAATLGAAGLLLVPTPPAGGVSALFGVPHVDKLVHLLLFLALGWIWRRALARRGRPLPDLALFAALVGYGALLELAQAASGLRTAEWADLAADALGAGLVPLGRWSYPRTGRGGGSAEAGAVAPAGAEAEPARPVSRRAG